MKEEKRKFNFNGALIGQWLGFIAISLFLLKILDVVSWSWIIIFAPILFPGILATLGLMILSLATRFNEMFFSFMVKKCNDCEDGLKENKNEHI